MSSSSSNEQRRRVRSPRGRRGNFPLSSGPHRSSRLGARLPGTTNFSSTIKNIVRLFNVDHPPARPPKRKGTLHAALARYRYSEANGRIIAGRLSQSMKNREWLDRVRSNFFPRFLLLRLSHNNRPWAPRRFFFLLKVPSLEPNDLLTRANPAARRRNVRCPPAISDLRCANIVLGNPTGSSTSSAHPFPHPLACTNPARRTHACVRKPAGESGKSS